MNDPTVLLLSNGDAVIGGLAEVKKDDQAICLSLSNPYKLEVVSVNGTQQVQMSKWFPFAAESSFKIPYSSVTTYSQPHPDIKTAYINQINSPKKKGYASDVSVASVGM